MSRYIPDGLAHAFLSRLRQGRDPTDVWYSRRELDRQRRDEEAERRFQHMVRRRREFELTLARWEAETDAELREAWEWADAVARGDVDEVAT
jgi:hypothetical protein